MAHDGNSVNERANWNKLRNGDILHSQISCWTIELLSITAPLEGGRRLHVLQCMAVQGLCRGYSREVPL